MGGAWLPPHCAYSNPVSVAFPTPAAAAPHRVNEFGANCCAEFWIVICYSLLIRTVLESVLLQLSPGRIIALSIAAASVGVVITAYAAAALAAYVAQPWIIGREQIICRC